MSEAWRLRTARRGDLPAMAEIERSADARFKGSDLDWLGEAEPTPSELLAPYCDAGSAWVVEDGAGRLGGFLVAGPRDSQLILFQISVALDLQGLGLGKRLMLAALQAGRRLGLREAALTTYRDVAWNAPWYARFGFVEVGEEDQSDALRQMLANEAAAGHDPARRCAMVLVL